MEVTLKSYDSMLDELAHARRTFEKEVSQAKGPGKRVKQTEV